MTSPNKSRTLELDQLRAQLAGVGTVGTYNEQDVILRDSVLELVDRLRNARRVPYPIMTIHAMCLRIEVSKDQLLFAAENHPDFWDGKSGMDVPNIKIANFDTFSHDFVRAVNAEAEDGSTLATRMFDKAIAKAVNDGSDGVQS